jgi:hypothetical protein
MPRLLLAAAVRAAATAPATARAGTYYVRNDTPRAQSCGMRRPSTQVAVRVVIPRGREWSRTYERDAARVLVCYTGPNRNTFLLEAGRHYSLREGRDGILRLRPAEGN